MRDHRVAHGVLYTVVLVGIAGALAFGRVSAMPLLPGDVGVHTDHGEGVITLFGRLHPAIVHFPIALVVLAGVAELLAARRRSEMLGFVARFNLYAAAAAAIPAAVLGFAAAAGRSFEGPDAAYFSVHRVVGVVIPVLAILTAGLAASAHRTQQRAPRVLYRVLLLLTVACVIVAAYYGGLLVFGPEHFEP